MEKALYKCTTLPFTKHSRIIYMKSATSETIKFGRFELCATCVEYSTASVEYSANVQLVFQTSNFSCTEYNA